jgi:hypothetical protein
LGGRDTVKWPKRLARLAFFDLPRPDRGGLLAPINYVGSFFLAILRATVLGCVLLVPTVMVGGPHVLESPAGRLWASLAFVLFEELARLNYAQQARRPIVALVVFLVLIQAVETFAYLNQAIANGAFQEGGMNAYLLSRLPATGVHVIATLLLALGFVRRRTLAPIFVGVVIAHVAFDFWAPQVVTAITGVDHVAVAAGRGQ